MKMTKDREDLYREWFRIGLSDNSLAIDMAMDLYKTFNQKNKSNAIYVLKQVRIIMNETNLNTRTQAFDLLKSGKSKDAKEALKKVEKKHIISRLITVIRNLSI